MKPHKRISGGAWRCIIGAAVLFASLTTPIVFLNSSVSDDVGLGVMVLLFFSGAFVMIAGGIVLSREKKDPDYRAPKNIFRIFKAWQLLLLASPAAFCVGVSLELFGLGWVTQRLAPVIVIVTYCCPVAAAVVGSLQRRKSKNGSAAPGSGKPAGIDSAETTPGKCCVCGKRMLPAELCRINGKTYCTSCRRSAFAPPAGSTAKPEPEKRSAAEPAAQSAAEIPRRRCGVCGAALPEADFYYVNDRFLCAGCFRKAFPPDGTDGTEA